VSISISRILLSRHLCTKPNPFFVLRCSRATHRLAVSSSRRAFVQPGPRLSPTLLPLFSMSTPLPFLFALVSSLPRKPRKPCKPCETTLWHSVSIPSTSTTSHWRRISHFCGLTQARHEELGCHQYCRQPLASTQSRAKRTAQLNAQLTLLEHDLKKGNEHAARNSLQMSAPTGARPDGKRNICSQEPKKAAGSDLSIRFCR